MRSRFVASITLALSMALAISSAAHPLVDEARSRLDHAEFESALELLGRAERTGSLERREILKMLELEALIHLALGRRQDAEHALLTLATLEPAYRFEPNTSPDLLTAFAFVRRKAPPPPKLLAEHQITSTGITVQARATGDRLGLIEALGIRARVGSGAWKTYPTGEVNLTAAPRERIQYRALAKGRAGVLLETPMREVVMPASRADEESSTAMTWLLVGGGALTVAAVIGTVLFLSGGSSETQPSAPMLGSFSR